MTRGLWGAWLGVLLSAVTAAAQTGGSPYEQRYQPPVSIRVEAIADSDWLAANRSFDALVERHRITSTAGGFEVHLRQGLFVEFTASRTELDGQQAFYSGGTVYRLGIPVRLVLQPVELVGGYRFMKGGRFVPYGGAGLVSLGFEQTTTGNDPSENVKVRQSGWVAKGGLEFRVHPWIGVAGEVAYLSVKGVLGDSGLSQVFNERDLGGTSVRVKVLVGR